MPVTVKFLPSVSSTQAQVIPNATPKNDGVMTAAQALALTKVTTGVFGSVILANGQPGEDIGAQIMSAFAALGAAGGTVVTADGDYLQTTKVVIPENTVVVLGNGVYANTFAPSTTPHWLLKSGATLRGSGWGTVIQGPVFNSYPEETVIVGDYATWQPGGISAPGESDVTVEDIHFVANPGSTPVNGAQTPAVMFGNVTNAWCRRCYFDGCEGYGVFQQSDSSTGNFASNVYIEECLFENIRTQNAGFINGENLYMRGNTFRLPSQNGPTIIDCEQNVSTDHGRNLIIDGNIIDCTTSPIVFQPGNLIALTAGGGAPGDRTGRWSFCTVTNNICLGGTPAGQPHFAGGIGLSRCDFVDVNHNEIGSCYAVGIAVNTCTACTVTDNAFVSAGGISTDGGSVGPIQLRDSTGCTVGDNVMVEPLPSNQSLPRILEVGASDYNVYYGNRMYFAPPSDLLASEGFAMRVDLVGTNSRVFDSIYGQSSTDPRILNSVAELGACPPPGTRAAGSPPLAIVASNSAVASGGWTLWYFDPLSTSTANGVTVVAPPFGAAGRWHVVPGQIQLTTTQRTALALTASDASLQVFDTTLGVLCMWTGASWVQFTTAALP